MLKKKTKTQFENAVDLFDSGENKKALISFQYIVQINPHDLAAIAYINYCNEKLLTDNKIIKLW